MLALTQSTDETSHLAVLQGSDVIYLDKREPLKPGVRLVTEIGTRLPAHLTASRAGDSEPSGCGTDQRALRGVHLADADRNGSVDARRTARTARRST